MSTEHVEHAAPAAANPFSTAAAFCVGVQCAACMQVSGLSDVRSHPSTGGAWQCQHCGRQYPNSDALKANAPHVSCVIIPPAATGG